MLIISTQLPIVIAMCQEIKVKSLDDEEDVGKVTFPCGSRRHLCDIQDLLQDIDHMHSAVALTYIEEYIANNLMVFHSPKGYTQDHKITKQTRNALDELLHLCNQVENGIVIIENE